VYYISILQKARVANSLEIFHQQLMCDVVWCGVDWFDIMSWVMQESKREKERREEYIPTSKMRRDRLSWPKQLSKIVVCWC
jgi:hypothetical protein